MDTKHTKSMGCLHTGSFRPLQNLCQGTLKLFLRLVVFQRAIKMLGVFFILAVTCSSMENGTPGQGKQLESRKREYNISYKVRNDTIYCVEHLKSCVTILRALLFLKICIWLFLEPLFMFFWGGPPILHNTDEEVICCLG